MLSYFQHKQWIPYWMGMGFSTLAAISNQLDFNLRMILLFIGICWTIVFMVVSVSEVRGNQLISKRTQNLWTAGLVISSSLVGFIYLYFFRRKFS